MAMVLVFLRAEAGRVAPSPQLAPWLVFMFASLAYLVVIQVSFAFQSVRDRLSARTWVRGIELAAFLFCAGIVASVWIIMPPADNSFRMLMIILYLWFIAVVMMVQANRLATIGCLAVVLSLACFLLTHNVPYRLPITVFLAMVGGSLIIVRRLIWRVAEQAVAARQLSERAAKSLEAAVAIVAAERDAKTRFIASATHDLQQPIQAARLFVDQALGQGEAALKERAARNARTAFESVQSLLESMLDHLRLEGGAVTPTLSVAPLASVIDTVVLEHGETAARAGMAIIVCPSRLSALHDPELLRRALGNLVGNALRHSDGSRVLIGVRRSGDNAVIWVIDDGKGVPPQDGEAIFADFAQGADRGRGGFGVGLSSARRLAHLQRGDIGLDPRWRSGSAFFLRLGGVARSPRTLSPSRQLERTCTS